MKKWLAAVLGIVVFGVASLLLFGSDNPKPAGCGDAVTPAAPAPTGAVVVPVAAGSYQISSPFGPRDGGFHQGQDMAGALGTPILAATDGTVAAAGHATGFGDWIVLDTDIDGGKVSTVYGHMYDDGVLVHTGDKVRAGQHIANMGSNGESTGSHLHFEVWPGGRLSGGKAIDPMPWLTQHGASATPGAPAAPRAPPEAQLAAATTPTVGGGGEMPVLPASKGSEAHWQVDTVRIARAVSIKFPEIKTIGGWRPTDAYPDHPSGRAADIMIPDPTSPAGKALGDRVADYVMANKAAFHVVYIIWQQTYRPAQGEPNKMEDRGSPTQNHMDHVHVTDEGHGYPGPGQTYGPPPEGGAAPTTVAQGPCAGAPTPAGGGGNLKAGSVPPAFAPWIIKAAGTCPEVPAPILAAQLENEAGFRTDAVSPTGADGPSQFEPGTWESQAIDGDGDGRKDPRSIPDAVMSQASYDCKLAKIAKDNLASGKLHGDLTELYLSMYNCGDGGTLSQGGVCQNSQTLNYVKNIPARAASVFADNSAAPPPAAPGNTSVLADATPQGGTP